MTTEQAKPRRGRPPGNKTKANTNQQIGLTDLEITDADQVQAVKEWWETEKQFNAHKAQMSFGAQEKAVKVAKDKALTMIEVPGDGSKHRIRVDWGDGGTVIMVSPPGEPTEKLTKRTPKTQFKLDGTKAQEL